MGSEKLTKAELVESIAEQHDLNRRDVQVVIDSFFEEVKTALLDDKVAEFRGFGTFELRTRKGREKARNPRTGELVAVKDHGVVAFRPGKELKQAAWNLRS
ncbi:HU family DNA-binding protein [Spirochaeta dissipatitropha]